MVGTLQLPPVADKIGFFFFWKPTTNDLQCLKISVLVNFSLFNDKTWMLQSTNRTQLVLMRSIFSKLLMIRFMGGKDGLKRTLQGMLIYNTSLIINKDKEKVKCCYYHQKVIFLLLK